MKTRHGPHPFYSFLSLSSLHWTLLPANVTSYTPLAPTPPSAAGLLVSCLPWSWIFLDKIQILVVRADWSHSWDQEKGVETHLCDLVGTWKYFLVASSCLPLWDILAAHRFLHEIQLNCGVNKMSVDNLATVIGVNLIRSKVEDPAVIMRGTIGPVVMAGAEEVITVTSLPNCSAICWAFSVDYLMWVVK